MSFWAFVMVALALAVMWLLRERGRTVARLDALEQLLFEGSPLRDNDPNYLERQLLGLRSPWHRLEVPLELLIDSLVGFSFGMSQATVEAEAARRSGGKALAIANGACLNYCISGVPWLGYVWSVNLRVEGGRLLEVFIFRAGHGDAPGVRDLVDEALLKKLGQPLPHVASASTDHPSFVALASHPTLQDRKGWRMPLSGVTLNVTAMSDDANAGVSLAAAVEPG
jgi:hypothetical protein